MPKSKKNLFASSIAQQNRIMRKANLAYPKDSMVEMPKEKVQADGHKERIAAFRSRDFLAQVFALEGSDMMRLSVQRMELAKHGGFVDLITWDDLQWVKRQVGFGMCDAVEAFPADEDVVQTDGMRHLFVFPPNYVVPFFQRVEKKEQSNDEGAAGEPAEGKIVSLGLPSGSDDANGAASGGGGEGQPGEAPLPVQLQAGMDEIRGKLSRVQDGERA